MIFLLEVRLSQGSTFIFRVLAFVHLIDSLYSCALYVHVYMYVYT